MKHLINLFIVLFLISCSEQTPESTTSEPAREPEPVIGFNSSASTTWLNSGGSLGTISHLVNGWKDQRSEIMAPAWPDEHHSMVESKMAKLREKELIGYDHAGLEKNSPALQVVKDATFTYVHNGDTITRRTDIEIYWENGKYGRWITYFDPTEL